MSDSVCHLGDCLDPVTGLASLSDRSVDHVICDPPYSEHVHTNGRRGSTLTSGHGREPGGAVSQRRPLDFDYLPNEARRAAAAGMARIARRWVLVFSDTESSHLWSDTLVAGGFEYVRTGFWRRLDACPQFSGDRPAAACEAITISHPPGGKAWNGGGRQAFYEFGIAAKSGERQHPTQKPLALMEALVRDFTDPGDLVCDPFAGSGTTGVACRRLGRRFVGWELDPKYHAIAVKRIAAAREQLGLFREREPKPKQSALDLASAAPAADGGCWESRMGAECGHAGCGDGE